LKYPLLATVEISDEIVTPNPIYGKITNPDGEVEGVLVTINLLDQYDYNSQTLSTVTNDKGGWSLDVSNVLYVDLEEKFDTSSDFSVNIKAKGSENVEGESIFNSDNLQPTPDLQLQKVEIEEESNNNLLVFDVLAKSEPSNTFTAEEWCGAGEYCIGQNLYNCDENDKMNCDLVEECLYGCLSGGLCNVDKCKEAEESEDSAEEEKEIIIDPAVFEGYGKYCDGDTLKTCTTPTRCDDGVVCKNGCEKYPGMDDYCKGEFPAKIISDKQWNNKGGKKGNYCYYGDLLHCIAQSTCTGSENCEYGCIINLMGEDDTCANAPEVQEDVSNSSEACQSGACHNLVISSVDRILNSVHAEDTSVPCLLDSTVFPDSDGCKYDACTNPGTVWTEYCRNNDTFQGCRLLQKENDVCSLCFSEAEILTQGFMRDMTGEGQMDAPCSECNNRMWYYAPKPASIPGSDCAPQTISIETNCSDSTKADKTSEIMYFSGFYNHTIPNGQTNLLHIDLYDSSFKYIIKPEQYESSCNNGLITLSLKEDQGCTQVESSICSPGSIKLNISESKTSPGEYLVTDDDNAKFKDELFVWNKVYNDLDKDNLLSIQNQISVSFICKNGVLSFNNLKVTLPEIKYSDACPPTNNGVIIDELSHYTMKASVEGYYSCEQPLGEGIISVPVDDTCINNCDTKYFKGYIFYNTSSKTWDDSKTFPSKGLICTSDQKAIERIPGQLECVSLDKINQLSCSSPIMNAYMNLPFHVLLSDTEKTDYEWNIINFAHGSEAYVVTVSHSGFPIDFTFGEPEMKAICNNGHWEFDNPELIDYYLSHYKCSLTELTLNPTKYTKTGHSIPGVSGTINGMREDPRMPTYLDLFQETDYLQVTGTNYKCKLRCNGSDNTHGFSESDIVDCVTTIFDVPVDINSPDTYTKPDIFHKVSASSGSTEGTVINESGVYAVEGVSTTVQNQFEIIVTDEDEGMLVKFFEDTNSNGKRDEGEEYMSSEGINLKKTQDIMTYELTEGWNLVSFPVVSDKVKTASDLLVEIAGSNGYATHIATYRDGKWQMYSQRAEVSFSEDFNILPGVGYFIRVHKETTLNITGNKFEESVPLDLSIGWNLVGIVSPKTSYTADSLINKAVKSEVSADTVTKWVSGKYVNYIKEGDTAYGEDFMLFEKGGYFVRVKDKGGKLEL